MRGVRTSSGWEATGDGEGNVEKRGEERFKIASTGNGSKS